jgi:hypothetical protein
LIAVCWALCDLVLFGTALLLICQRPQLRGEARFAVDRPGELRAKGRRRGCVVIDLSVSGALLGGAEDLAVGDAVRLSLCNVGDLPGTVVRKTAKGEAAIDFAEVAEDVREKLILYLYTSDRGSAAREVKTGRVLWQLLRGAIIDPG